MTPEEREQARQAFADKNERRREARGMWVRDEAEQGRSLRQACGGVFGKMGKAEWNLRVRGTTGETR